jgi:glycosyltransferase involved in cell wall biosynthesis
MLDVVTEARGQARVRPQSVVVIGGTARSLINFRGPLLALLKARGHRVVTAAQPDAAIEEVREALGGMAIPFQPLSIIRGGMNPLADWRGAREIRQLIEIHRPEVVIAYTAKPVIYAGLVARRLPGLRFYPMITGLGYAFSNEGGWRLALLRLAVRRLYRRSLVAARTTIFQNPDDLALFRELGLTPPGGQTAWVHGSGVDRGLFPPRPLPEAPVFLMLSRLMVDKGVREYLEAARRVKRQYPEARFQLAGALDPNPSSIRQAELDAWVREGTLEYLGKLHGVQAALAGCRYYVLPSSYREGTPRSVLEAMATGRPIITTDAPGCRETVDPGVNGYLVPPRDPEALAEAMLRLLTADNRSVEAMAEASLDRVARLFDVERVNRQLMEITGL